MFSEFEVVNVLSHNKGEPYTHGKCYTIAEKDYIIHTFSMALVFLQPVFNLYIFRIALNRHQLSGDAKTFGTNSFGTKIRCHRPNWVENVIFVSFIIGAIILAP